MTDYKCALCPEVYHENFFTFVKNDIGKDYQICKVCMDNIRKAYWAGFNKGVTEFTGISCQVCSASGMVVDGNDTELVCPRCQGQGYHADPKEEF